MLGNSHFIDRRVSELMKTSLETKYCGAQGQNVSKAVSNHSRLLLLYMLYLGFSGSSAGEESACSVGDSSSVPGSGRSPGEGIGYPFQYSWTSLVAQTSQVAKNPPAVDGRCGFDPWVGKITAAGHGNLLQYSCLQNPHGQRSLVGYSPWVHKESNMTEQLSRAHSTCCLL